MCPSHLSFGWLLVVLQCKVFRALSVTRRAPKCVSQLDVHPSAFSICILYRSILAQQREFFEHPIQRPLLLSSTRPDPTCLAFSSVRLTRYSSVGSLRLSWCVLLCCGVRCCVVLCSVVFCCVLLFCCFVVLLFRCFVVWLCFIMLCWAVPCFASSSRTAHCSKYEIQIVTVGWLSGVEVPCAFRGFASAGRRFRAAVWLLWLSLSRTRG